MLVSGVVLAHQGGWDEALMVIVPVGLFVGLLWAATRRAAQTQEGDRSETVVGRDGSNRGVLHPAEHRGDR